MTTQFPTAVPAATVILIRPADAGFEVYLLKRSTASKFMAGTFVFPGGVVDAIDSAPDQWMDHVDMDESTLDIRLGGGLTSGETLGYGVAAIRETFEEAGVLLAIPRKGQKDDFAEALRRREGGDHPPGWFRELVAGEDFCLELTRLYRWAHWITPSEMKRHYDTRFFVAAMPPDQVCRPDARETTQGVWMRPIEGLQANMKGEVGLSPPTVVTLQALSKFESYEALQADIANRPWGEPQRPRYIQLGRDAVIVEPWDPQFAQAHIDLDPDALVGKLLSAGSDFSRIWLHEGLWRPVAV